MRDHKHTNFMFIRHGYSSNMNANIETMGPTYARCRSDSDWDVKPVPNVSVPLHPCDTPIGAGPRVTTSDYTKIPEPGRDCAVPFGPHPGAGVASAAGHAHRCRAGGGTTRVTILFMGLRRSRTNPTSLLQKLLTEFIGYKVFVEMNRSDHLYSVSAERCSGFYMEIHFAPRDVRLASPTTHGGIEGVAMRCAY